MIAWCVWHDSISISILNDVQLFTWYADTTNFVKNIRPAYAKILSFPSTYLVPMRLKSDAKARLAKYNVEIKDDDKGLPQNEVEEMKELQRTGWHYVSCFVSSSMSIPKKRSNRFDFARCTDWLEKRMVSWTVSLAISHTCSVKSMYIAGHLKNT